MQQLTITSSRGNQSGVDLEGGANHSGVSLKQGVLPPEAIGCLVFVLPYYRT